MVTSGTDDKSRTSESNLVGENERAKIESSFLRYVRAYYTNRGRISLSLFLYHSLFHSLRDRSLYLELYMPQFRICVKQCAKLPAHIAYREAIN